jgi:hypothetical protein
LPFIAPTSGRNEKGKPISANLDLSRSLRWHDPDQVSGVFLSQLEADTPGEAAILIAEGRHRILNRKSIKKPAFGGLAFCST